MNVTLPALSSLAKIAFFCAFVASGLIVATNPDYLLPATPECVALASLLLWATGSGILGVRHIPQKDRWLLGGILFSVICLGIAAFWSVRHSQCFAAGGAVFRLECFLQSSVLLPYGLRQYAMTFFATITFATAALGAGRLTGNCFLTPKNLPIFGLLGVVIGELFHLVTGGRILPDWAGLSENPSWWGVAGFFTNYSWVWPYLAPAWALGLSSLLSLDVKRRLMGIAMTITILVLALINQQRGFFLLIGSGFFTLLVFIGTEFIARRSAVTRWRVIQLLIILAVTFIALYNLEAISSLVPSIGLPSLKTNRFSASGERLLIWKYALSKVAENPWGHGYGSWFEISKQSTTLQASGLIFDTPHNLIIELLVEFGVIPTAFLLFLWSTITFRMWKLAKSRELRLLIVLAVTALVATISVQEITYIRPTYMMWAAFGGGIWGACWAESVGAGAMTVSSARQKNWLWALAGIFFAFALFGVRFFSFNGFAFEPNGAGSVERWFGPSAVLTAPPGRKSGWLLYPSVVHISGESQTITFNNFTFQDPASTGWSFPVRMGSLGGAREPVTLSSGNSNFSRVIAFKTMYPPITFTVPVIWRQNASFIGSTRMKCEGEPCRVVLNTCSEGAQHKKIGVSVSHGAQVIAFELPAAKPFNMKRGEFKEPLEGGQEITGSNSQVLPDFSGAAILFRIIPAKDVAREFDMEFSGCQND